MLASALNAVVLANERYVLRRVVLQAGLISVAVAGLVFLEGAWWWASLVVLVLLTLGLAQLVFFIVAWNRNPVDRPWRALALGARRKREQVVELHGVDGEVLLMPVPLSMVEGVVAAAGAEGIPVVRDEAERKRLTANSARTERFRELEELLPHVPDPALRREVLEVFALIRERDPLAANDALEAPLHELEIKLMAERTAQTDSPLRGPRTVFGAEIASLAEDLRRLLAP
jgi:hypothetical protein